MNTDWIKATAYHDVEIALSEDVGALDLTASLIEMTRHITARIMARESAVICGQPWVEAAIYRLDPEALLTWHLKEGEWCLPNQTVLSIKGNARQLLTAERTALNFLQMMSAVSTKTAAYVEAVKGTSTHIVDTRKTLPGLRNAQKYAVHCGGGVNHRMGLYDAVLIKENHIAAAGGVSAVLKHANTMAPNAKFIQIEVETLAQLSEALSAGATMILLDNMDLATIREAVIMNQSLYQGQATLEVSGGVTLDSVRTLADTGVHRISIGALTKDIKAIDFSMRFDNLQCQSIK